MFVTSSYGTHDKQVQTLDQQTCSGIVSFSTSAQDVDRCALSDRRSAADIVFFLQLSPVATLTSLCQLDVSFNNISDLASLSRLTGLTQLSIEGNKCASLQCLTALTCMMELYAAGNAVQEVKVGYTSVTVIM